MKNKLLQLPLACLLIASIGMALFAQGATAQTSIYTTSLTDINDSPIDLQQYAGKKICFMIVPLQADSIYGQVQSFCAAHADSSRLVLIGIPSIEEGYTQELKDSVQQLYAGLPLVLTTGMYTRKSSGSEQGELLQWLTDTTKNGHFDSDASGAGQLFMVSEGGKLYAVFDNGCSLDSDFLTTFIQMQVADEPSNP